jgi:polysaccharide export outer membrane protein
VALGAALALVTAWAALSPAGAEEAEGAAAVPAGYPVQPGDILLISVWKEPELQRETLVRPDGGFSIPLAGEVRAQGRPVAEIEQEIASRIARYIPEPVVTVSVLKVQGNKVHVVGKVARPGEYVMSASTDVMQALSMAGGTTPFASLNSILILRRGVDGTQTAIPFRYGDVEDGENLEQNILLQSGDVVVVP